MSIHLTKLCHDVVQNSYKDLHSLLDSIGDDDVSSRHERLVAQILIQRHRFARLLVAVRWFMSYSAFHYSAQATRDLGAKRSNVIIHGADTLWAVSGVVRGAVAHSSAVQEAAELLGATPYLYRIPRCMESGVGVDTFNDAFDTSSDESSKAKPSSSKPSDRMIVVKDHPGKDGKPQTSPPSHLSEVETEAVARLRAATTDLASRALPKNVKLLKLGVEPAGAAVRVGVPGAWTADLVLDRLKVSEAFFVLLRINIMVDGSPDAVTDIKRRAHASERSLPLTKEQHEPLRQMLDDRMRWAAGSIEGGDIVERARKALLCLCEAMSFDCCGKLALTHIRSQCRALVSQGIWSPQDFTVTEPAAGRDEASPIHVQYWLRSEMTDTVEISISSQRSSASASDDIANVLSVRSKLLSRKTDELLSPSSLDIERLLLHICRNRAQAVLSRVVQDCIPILPEFASLEISRSSTSVVSVMLLLSGESPELIFGISLCTGGVLSRCGGVFARSAALRRPQVEALKDMVWKGERFFSKKSPTLIQTLRGIIEKAVAAYSATTGEVKTLADTNVRPVTTNVHGFSQAHFKDYSTLDKRQYKASIGRESPRRVLQNKVTGKRDTEALEESQNRSACSYRRFKLTSRTGRALHSGRTAATMADEDEKAQMREVENLRAYLLREMQALKLLTAPPSNDPSTRSGKQKIPLKTTPIDAEAVSLHIRGCNGWTLRVALRNDVFDRDSPAVHPEVVSYNGEANSLRFSYPGISKRNIHSFRRDLIRARMAAVLITGLQKTSGRFKIKRRTPSGVTVEVGDMTLHAGLGQQAVEVEMYPKRPIISTQLIPLIEEMLGEAGMEMGQRFGGLLNLALPIGHAIQAVAPADPNKFRVRFSTALRARYVVGHIVGQKLMKYAIDIDGRGGQQRILIIDVARAAKVTTHKRLSGAAQQFSPLPMWDAVLNQLVARGKGRKLYDKAAVQITLDLLPAVLSVTVGTFR